MGVCRRLTGTLGGFIVAAILAAAAPASADSYVVGGATGALVSSGSGGWAWDGLYLTGLRAALEDPANFGPSGTVNRDIDLVNLSVVNGTTLSGIDMFIGPWVGDADAAAFQAAVVAFFLSGGDLFLLQDDSGHDALGTALGISTTASTGSVSNGGAPFFDGPFGVATDVTQFYLVGQLDPVAIAAHNGHIGGTNLQGQVTSAFWAAGEYAPGAGALFIIADIDMIATTTACGLPLCGASYSPLNSNGIYALNTFSFLQEQGGSGGPSPVPEPASMLLLGSGLTACIARARRRNSRN